VTITEARRIVANAVESGQIDRVEAGRRHDALFRISKYGKKLRESAAETWVADLIISAK
jgi:hypothetical protein